MGIMGRQVAEGGRPVENEPKLYQCLKPDCGWKWASRLPLPPRYCARCKRPNWDKAPGPPRPQSIAPPPKPRIIYPIHDLEVGQSVLLSWHIKNGEADLAKNASMNRAVRQEERRYGKKFLREPAPRGLKVTRLA